MPHLGVPWRYPGQGKAKRRKALRHLRLRDFHDCRKRYKIGFDHRNDHRQKNFYFTPRRGIMAETEYPGVAQLVGRDIWDVEVGCSSHLTRTKIPLKSTISEGFFLFFVYCGVDTELVILNI